MPWFGGSNWFGGDWHGSNWFGGAGGGGATYTLVASSGAFVIDGTEAVLSYNYTTAAPAGGGYVYRSLAIQLHKQRPRPTQKAYRYNCRTDPGQFALRPSQAQFEIQRVAPPDRYKAAREFDEQWMLSGMPIADFAFNELHEELQLTT